MKSNWIHCSIFRFLEQTHHFPRERKPLPPRTGRELVWLEAARLAVPWWGLWLLRGQVAEELRLTSLWGGLISSEVPSQRGLVPPTERRIPQEELKAFPYPPTQCPATTRD